MNDLEEALRSELLVRADAADREVSLLEPVARRVRRARRRCAMAASAMTMIAGFAMTVTVSASSVLQPGIPLAGNGSVAGAAGRVPLKTVDGQGAANVAGPSITYGTSANGLPAFSTRSAAVVYGPRVPVPPGWRWHDFGGIRFAAPGSWAVERNAWWGGCSPAVAPKTVVLGITAVEFGPICTGLLKSAATPGVVVGTGQYAAEAASDSRAASCLRLHAVQACLLQPGHDMWVSVVVYPPGAVSPTLVQIGLVSPAAVARAIFDSIRPAP